MGLAEYGAQLDRALSGGDWIPSNRIRLALKRRMLRAMASDDPQEIDAIRKVLGVSLERFKIGQNVRMTWGREALAWLVTADVEWAAAASELKPIPRQMKTETRSARDAVEAELRTSNQPRTTSELARSTGYAVETISRALSQLRTEGLVVTRKVRRNSLHQLAKTSLKMGDHILRQRTDHSFSLRNIAQIQELRPAPPPPPTQIDPQAPVKDRINLTNGYELARIITEEEKAVISKGSDQKMISEEF
jgi:DNA-binding transcriptional regulator YhcF (GntR family)